MKTYKIPIYWESYQYFDVEAENLQDALTKALSIFLSIPDDNYLDDSFELDSEILEEEYDEEFDIDEALKNINENDTTSKNND